MASLKPFYINLNDLAFLLAQVNFVPLFDGSANSNGIVNFDPATMDAWDAQGNKIWDHVTQSGSYRDTALDGGNVALLGQGFPQVSAPIGIRDVTGLHNNLFGDQAFWGTVDVPFRRDIPADFSGYVTTSGADYGPSNSVLDYMPRIISRTITTGGVNLLQDGSGHFVEWDSGRYATDSAYAALIDASGADITQLVDGAKIVAPVSMEIQLLDAHGDPVIWSLTSYQTSALYALTLATQSVLSLGGLFGSASGGPLVDGGPIYTQPVAGQFVLNTALGNFDADLLAYKQLIDGAGLDFGSLVTGAPIVTTVEQSSGYGLLETLGHIDFQNPTSGEFFIGSENPGVAPVNSWFGIFGQFFDHGLDLIGKGGNGKITIALDPSDPLYRAPGTHGPTDLGVTKMTVTRATINGTDANGDPNYINHTSPFIDQSQTYGSVDQITQLLREWVPDSDGTGFHSGMTLFDGQTLEDAWERRWPDGTSEMVHNTLPTLNELRDHVADTGRAVLNWDDVGNYRNRDASGQLADSDAGTPGIQTSGSGHALLLDMNPLFDAAHLGSTQAIGSTTVGALVAQAVLDLDASIDATITNAFGTLNPGRAVGGDSLTQNPDGSLNLHLGTDLVIPAGADPMTIAAGDYGGANAMMLWIDFSTFSVMAPPASVENAAVGEILMAAVGDHYIAGDGRVNENFGLTSIHHVFHEEHNFQVENLKTWIYAHDANTSPVDHAGLHAWQISTGTQDANGNFLDANGAIAWDADKMFEATKLIVEMEYQHAAVDQYARTVTPRIQEFVGYSTGVDSTISLEYSQVAFRFGHSTIRETIDAVDPSGWMMGHVTRYALEKAFLNPGQFAETGVAAITLGLARQQMNEVDEFVTPALSQGLLDQPLDLPAINIARGRDLGIPTLNDFREGISLARYTSWDDFGKNMIHPESLVNFIAAYSFGGDITKAEAVMGLFDGSILEGDTAALGYTAADALAFMLDNAAVNAELDAGRDGFNHIDSWIGGLAEAHVPGGLLGETFDAVFVAQIQSLMDGDRFYYLYRLFGTNLHEEVNNGQFKDIVERNTGLSHLNGSIFAYADKYYDFNRQALPPNTVLFALDPNNGNQPVEYYTDQNGQLWATRTGAGTLADPFAYSGKIDADHPPVSWALFDVSAAQVGSDTADHGYGTVLALNPGLGIYSDGGASSDPNGDLISVTGSDFVRPSVTNTYIRDVRPELDPTQVHTVEGTPTSGADSHEVIVATGNADFIHARSGDDTVYGEGGNDFIYGDGGVDRMYGGDGHDMIDTGEGPDLADGGAGKDIIYGRGSGSEVGGFDQLVGGTGNDLLIGGEGIDKLSGGAGDDIVYGDGLTNPEMGNTDAFTHGGDGNDYMDGGASGDLLFGEEGDDYIVGGIDQDLMQGGRGDDIIRPGGPSQASGTTGGPDEVVGDDAQANLGFDLIDLSDWAGNASTPGAVIDFSTQTNPLIAIDQTTPFPAWFQIEGAIGTKNGDTFIGDSDGDASADNSHGNNWLIGGSGNDSFTGAGGNDIIVGGSIRLDDLVGRYSDAVVGNLALGSAAWLADAMGLTPGGIGYDNDEESAYTGASNRTIDTDGTSGGLIEAVNATIADAADHFGKHFTDMLESRMFKDVVLGDGGMDGTADTAIFTGKMSEYSIEVIAYMLATGETIQALKITDNGGLVDDGTGVLVARAEDGIDILVGIETGVFADQTISLIPTPPVLDLDADHIVTTTTTFSENFGSTSFTLDDGSWTQDWTEIGDNNGTGGNITITGGFGGVLQFNDNVATGASISRAVDLSGATSASIAFDWSENGADNGENILVQAYNGSTWDTLDTLLGRNINNANGSPTYNLSASQIGSHSAIRFESSGGLTNGETFSIDNLVVSKNISAAVSGASGTGHTASYTENGPRVAIAAFPSIADDSATIAWAKVVLTNAVAGDALRMGNSNGSNGNLGGGVSYQADTSVAGQITLTITGQATKAQYQGFLDQVRFFSTSDNPTDFGAHATRTIDVTVNDGLWTSNVATTAVTIAAIDDPIQAGSDQIVTSFTSGQIVVPEWVLLANDFDPDSPVVLDVTGVTENSTRISNLSLSTTPGSVTLDYNGSGTFNTGGSFNYTLNGNSQPNPSVSVNRDTQGTVSGGNGSDILVGDGNGNTFDGGAGNDFVLAGGGNDTIVWSAGGVGGGRDFVDGGSGVDTFAVNGSNAAEAFAVYSNTDDWDNNAANGVQSSAAHAGLTGLNALTEIVITRDGAIIAELDNVEEIVIDSNGGTDSYAVVGSFSASSLFLQTITINGGGGNDTVDISGLTSDHRIVFHSNGGNDTVVGAVRPQDVVDFDDVMRGTFKADRFDGGSGNDKLSGLAGNDRLLGGLGHDTIKGGAGRDTISGGLGDDLLSGGAGRDFFVFREGFGHDVVTDFDANPNGGQDKIVLRDMEIEDDTFTQHVRILDAGADTLVRIDGQTIRLAGVTDHHSVTMQDFILS